jgi:type I restriction enzyme S subunit
LLRHDVCFVNKLCCFSANQNNKFRFYFAQSQNFKDKFGLSLTGLIGGVSTSLLKNFQIPTPSDPEQTAIAEFLDRETGKIDGLVAEQRRLMELLKEKRQAVISHAVTKGLNPHAPMKPSGIEWLGDVPEHWGVASLGTLAKMIQTGPFGSQLHSEDYVENGIPVINPSNIQDGKIEPDWSCSITIKDAQRLSQHKLIEGDIVFGRRGEMGRCALVSAHEVGWICGTGSLNVRLLPRAFPPFISIYLRTEYVREWLKLESVGSTMDNLNTQILGSIKVPLPDLKEQEAIMAYLDTELLKFDPLTAEAQRAIDLLQERRTVLISAAVTGQIDVRNHTPSN